MYAPSLSSNLTRKNRLRWWQKSVALRIPPEKISCAQRKDTWIWINGASRKSEAIWRCFWLCHKAHRCGLVKYFCQDFFTWQEKKNWTDFSNSKTPWKKRKSSQKKIRRFMGLFQHNHTWRYNYVFWVLLCQNGKIHDRLISQVFHLGQPLLHEKINLLLNTFIFIFSLCRYKQT